MDDDWTDKEAKASAAEKVESWMFGIAYTGTEVEVVAIEEAAGCWTETAKSNSSNPGAYDA